jgi:hypothetical protein
MLTPLVSLLRQRAVACPLCLRLATLATAVCGLLLTAPAQVTNWMRSRAPDETGPLGRDGHSMAYDARRQRVVMFGGWAGPFFFFPDDTWEWDGAKWTLRVPLTKPPARQWTTMAHDVVLGRTLLYGGFLPGAPNWYSDTWEWTGDDWVQRSPVANPGPRRQHAMAFDLLRRRTVLYGGYTVNSVPLYDTWEWDGSSWQQKLATRNPGVPYGAMAYDARRQRTVLFAGPAAGTWEWDGSSWQLRFTPSSPDAPAGQTMVFDSDLGRLVLFVQAGQTWEYDGLDWQRRATVTSPTARSGAAMAYDVARQRVALFGGWGPSHLRETWLHGRLIPASAQAFGSGCAGSSGPPVLTSDDPYLGNPAFRMRLGAARPSAACLFGLSGTTLSLPIGPCTLYLGNPWLMAPVVSTSMGAAASPPLGLPLDVGLRGSKAYGQAFVLDPSGPVLGLTFSGGQILSLGD